MNDHNLTQQPQDDADKNGGGDDTRSFSFDPPLYIQRKMFISNYLRQWYYNDNDNYNGNDNDDEYLRVIDVGCGNGNLLTYLREGITSHDMPYGVLDGIDKCETSLNEALNEQIRPMIHHHLQPFDHLLTMTLYQMDIVNENHDGVVVEEKNKIYENMNTRNEKSIGIGGYYDVTVCTEVMEHVYDDGRELNALTHFLFHVLCSDMIIVTTPNRDFNPWFFGYDPSSVSHDHVNMPINNTRQEYWMRHDDHKFEMSRVEFERWAHDSIHQFNNNNNNNIGCQYELAMISGVGTGTNGDLSLGYATQIAIFKRVNNHHHRNTLVNIDNDDPMMKITTTTDHENRHHHHYPRWKVYGRYEYPIRQPVDPYLLLTCECTRICNQYEQQQVMMMMNNDDEEQNKDKDNDDNKRKEEEEEELEQLALQGWRPVSHVFQQLKQRNVIRTLSSMMTNHDEKIRKQKRKKRMIEERLLINNEQELIQLLKNEYPYDYSFMEYNNNNNDKNNRIGVEGRTDDDSRDVNQLSWFMRVEYISDNEEEEEEYDDEYNDFNDEMMDDHSYDNNNNNNEDQWDTWHSNEDETSWTVNNHADCLS